MTNMAQEEVFETIQKLLDDLGKTEARIKQLELAKDNKIKKILDDFGARVDPFVTIRDELVTKITALFEAHREFLTAINGGKTIVFRGGTLSAKMAAPKLVVEDEKVAIDYITRAYKKRRFTTTKVVLNKVALKKDPAFVKKARGIRIEQLERLSIKLPKLDVERFRDLNPLRTTLRKS